MTKYSSENVLAIKHDLQNAQSELLSIRAQIAKEQEELNFLRQEAAAFRSETEHAREGLENSLVRTVHAGRGTLKELENMRLRAQKELDTLDIIVRVKQAEANKEKPLPQLRFAKLAVEELREQLNYLDSKKELTEAETKRLEEIKSQLATAVNDLEEQRKKAEGRLKILEAELEDAARRRGELLGEIAAEEETLEIIRIREHDTAVLQMRLSEEYQAAYKQLPHR